MQSRYLPFADWMKAVGMALIVWGHVAARVSVTWTPPFYVKQLGVAFFVFVMGFTLAREQRSTFRAVFSRYFQVFAFGLVGAVCTSAIGLALWGDASPSNYLPLVGLQFIQDAFPANPTTWYIGTYLHLLLLWAVVLRGRTIRWRLIATVVPAEIVIRAVAAQWVGLYFAYMLLTNWTSVLLLGLLFGQRNADRASAPWLPGALFIVAWPLAMRALTWQPTFPFMSATELRPWLNALVVASLVGIAYPTYTASAFALLSRLPEHAAVRFFARNTVIIFIAHMPLYYLLEHLLAGSGVRYGVRVTIEFMLCFGGLAVLSELLLRAVDVRALGSTMIAKLDASMMWRPRATENLIRR